MRKSLSMAALLVLAATGSAFAFGPNSDRGDTNPYVTSQSAQESVQVPTSSQTADAAVATESLR